MRIYADLHIHSKYSRATSEKMDIEDLVRFARLKGLNLLGTGDATHPGWLRELERKLVYEEDYWLYRPAHNRSSDVYFMVTTEVNTVFEVEGKKKRIHHLILLPSLEDAKELSTRLSKYGDLSSDGRPTLNMTPAELVEITIDVNNWNMVIPAHVWTPWFSVFGSRNGFNSVEECYEDMAKNIYALETGLSSDPAMNWMISSLDKYTLVSNSDSHSPWPYRLGREANVFELKEPSYREIYKAIKGKDKNSFLFTIEVDPAYGKYHFDGHRKCGVCLHPRDAKKLGGRCPVCGRKLTIGVLHRVLELADRPEGYVPTNAIPFKSIIPLQEVIAHVFGSDVHANRVWEEYAKLTKRFGNEFKVLLEVKLEELKEVTYPKLAEAIVKVRERRYRVKPGYDGVYGVLTINGEEEKRELRKFLTLEDFM